MARYFRYRDYRSSDNQWCTDSIYHASFGGILDLFAVLDLYWFPVGSIFWYVCIPLFCACPAVPFLLLCINKLLSMIYNI